MFKFYYFLREFETCFTQTRYLLLKSNSTYFYFRIKWVHEYDFYFRISLEIKADSYDLNVQNIWLFNKTIISFIIASLGVSWEKILSFEVSISYFGTMFNTVTKTSGLEVKMSDMNIFSRLASRVANIRRESFMSDTFIISLITITKMNNKFY